MRLHCIPKILDHRLYFTQRAPGSEPQERYSSLSTPFAHILLISLLLVVTGMASGCDGDEPPAANEPTVDPANPLVLETPAVAPDGELPAEPAIRELVLWTPDFFDPAGGGDADAILDVAYEQFEQMHPDVRIEVQTKAEVSTANLFNYLRSAHQVAPAILPDVILMDSQQLWRLADLGILPPLTSTGTIDLTDMYPFAMDAVMYDDTLYGIPYAADVIHLAQHSPTSVEGEFTTPTTWEALRTTTGPYLFPAGGRNGQSSNSLLLQYVGAGGQLMESGEVSSPEALRSVFDFLEAGVQAGVIPADVLEYSSMSAVWAVFTSTESGLADVSATRYLAERPSLVGSVYGPIPTQSGALTTIGHVWALSILSQDPAQRELALQFVEFMVDVNVQAPWTEQAARLPTRRSSFAAWQNPQPYHTFLQRLLDVAVAVPNGPAFAEFSAQLQAAQAAVLTGELSPEEAVSLLLVDP